jgi:four helix bundle protein
LSYQLSDQLPKQEIYGLTSQIRRASVSIPANIAEGKGRKHLKEYIHHLSIANGSLMELETHWLIAVRLGYIEEKNIENLMNLSAEIGRMLQTIMNKLRNQT